MTKRIKALDTKLDIARRATWASYFLFILSLIGGGHMAGTPLSLLIIVSLPLLLLLPGMKRENHKTLALLSFASLMYFIPLVVNVGEPDRTFFDVLSLVLICILFVAAMLFSRWIQYHRAGLGDPGAGADS